MSHWLVPAIYVVASVVAFVVYAFDKWAARAGRSRTPELLLHLLAVAGGWPGALAAQQVFRHKTRKLSFQLVFWLTVAANCGALWWWMSRR